MTQTDCRRLGSELGAALLGTPIHSVKELGSGPGPTCRVELQTRATGRFEVAVFRVEGTFTPRDGEAAVELEDALDLPLLVFARRFPEHLLATLESHGIHWVDAAGNARLALGGGSLHVQVAGRKPAPAQPGNERRGALRSAGLSALFALLADDALITATVREIESMSGASRHAVAELLARLRDEGALVRLGRSGHAWSPGARQRWIERFVDGWRDVLRDTQQVGRFRHPSQDAEQALEQVAAELERRGVPFGLGGTAGAMRLAPHYRGADAVLHVADWQPGLQRQLRLAPSSEGTITVLRCMGQVDLRSPVPGTAHPLLVYSELRRSRDPRAVEAAGEVFARHLRGLG